MNPHKIAEKELKNCGYFVKRRGSNHDIYYNDQTKSIIHLKRHDFDEDDLRYIQKEIKCYEKRMEDES